jgi:hypothetical protein
MNFSKNKLSIRDLKLLIIFAALVILFAAYRFVYFPNNQRTKKINEEVNQLKVTEQELQLKNSKVDEVLAKNDMITNEIDHIISRYGAGATTQKTLVFLENMEKETGMNISVIGFSEPESIYTSASKKSNAAETNSVTEDGTTAGGTTTDDIASNTAGNTTGDATADDGLSGENVSTEKTKPNTINGYNSVVSIEFKVSSEGLNKCIDYINHNSERKNIREINVVYDMETGNLSGSMQINMYQLTDTGKSYEDPAIAGVDIGTQNIFGTIEMP